MSTLSSIGLVVLAGFVVFGLLYRLRGGWFSNLSRRYGWEWGGKQRTVLMRLIWSIPVGTMLWYGTTPDSEMWYRALLCIGFVFASMALWGHGAHMVFTITEWQQGWLRGAKIETTELLTSWWLPKLFGGTPDPSWTNAQLIPYNLAGMTFIGLVRNLTTMMPFVILAPQMALWYTLLGGTHGLLYLLGEYTPRPKDYTGGEVAEFYVGGTSGAFLVWWLFTS
jgi:hypothetical protein